MEQHQANNMPYQVPPANILLVDDHAENLLALKSLLEDLGQNLITAGSGPEALRCLLAMDFALIVLDVQMPEMDGFETAMLIRERLRSRSTPIIFVTAYSPTEEQLFQGYASGAVDYLFKPLNPDVLRAKVLVFIELFNKTQQVQLQAQRLEAANLELQRQFQQVNRLNDELESFSYSVAHDLRAPLRWIGGYSQALSEDYAAALDQQGHGYLERICATCDHMNNLIADLLHFSRVTGNALQRTTVSLSALAASIADELRSSAPDRHVEFVIEDHLSATCDECLMGIVLENLIGNAWKFTCNHPMARIEFGAFTDSGDQQVYYVRDDGAGFNMEYATHLFGPFQRLHTEKEFEGTGIGLATVQRIIYRHGGRIWAEAAVERGATFFFTL